MRTSRRNKLQIVRHRRVIDQRIRNHCIGLAASYKQAEDISRRREVQLQVVVLLCQDVRLERALNL
jgi:hypothetical protein